jgi:hypothetical protein
MKLLKASDNLQTEFTVVPEIHVTGYSTVGGKPKVKLIVTSRLYDPSGQSLFRTGMPNDTESREKTVTEERIVGNEMVFRAFQMKTTGPMGQWKGTITIEDAGTHEVIEIPFTFTMP